MFQRSFINISLNDSTKLEENSQLQEDFEVNCSFLDISLTSQNLEIRDFEVIKDQSIASVEIGIVNLQ